MQKRKCRATVVETMAEVYIEQKYERREEQQQRERKKQIQRNSDT